MRRRPAAGVLLADEERDAALGGERRGHRPLRGRGRVRAAGVAQQHAARAAGRRTARRRRSAAAPAAAGAARRRTSAGTTAAAAARHPAPARARRRRSAARRPGRRGGRGPAARAPRPPRRGRAEGTRTCSGSSGSQRSGAARAATVGGRRAARTYCGSPCGGADGSCGPRGVPAGRGPAPARRAAGRLRRDGYHPAGPFRPLPEGAPPEVGPPTSQAPVPAPGPRPAGIGRQRRRPERGRLRPDRADRAGGPARRHARSSASATPAGCCRSSPTGRPPAS